MMTSPWTPPTLETDRLVLRPVGESDADAVHAACCNPNLTRFTLFETHRSMDDTLAFVREYAVANYFEKVPDPFAVTVKPAPYLVGAVGCRWASRPHRCMELGYWLAEPVWGHGYAAEAAAAVVRFAFANYQVERIQARVIVGNPASVRVLGKLGFRHEGTLRSAVFRRERFEDVLLFALLRDERGR